MPVEHSSYKGVMIYDGSVGENPVPGAFYQSTAGDILAGQKSGIGKRAYGDYKLWRLINDHPWNLQNVRRYTDNQCKQPVPLGSKQGNIIICKREGKYPILWIPPTTGEGPDEVKPQRPAPSSWARNVITPEAAAGEVVLEGERRTPGSTPPSGRGSTSRRQVFNPKLLKNIPERDNAEAERQRIEEQNRKAREAIAAQEAELARREALKGKSTPIWLIGVGLLAVGVLVATSVKKRRR